MEDMTNLKDVIIPDRLNKMKDLQQHKLLNDIMRDFLCNLIDYQDTANRNLEARVFNEIVDEESRYNVFITIYQKEDVSPIDEFLFPVFAEELETKQMSCGDILNGINSSEDIKLSTIFLKCDYTQIREIVKSARKYSGEIITDRKKYRIKVKLEQNKSYSAEIENLYNIFQKNNIPWKTINNPYLNKFYDVILTGCEGMLEEDEEIQEIRFNLEEYEKYRMSDIVLMWNIQKLNQKSDGFPMPAIDNVNYEHVISLKKLGLENGYLVDVDETLVKYIKRTEEELIIISPMELANTWDILRISQNPAEQNRKTKHELISNRRNPSFINKFAQKQSSLIRTKGEIARISNSFQVSRYFELVSIEIIPGKIGSATTYDFNSFIIDDIRIGNDKKVMHLKFRTDHMSNYLIHDLLSFIVSEIQMYFPEYECEGELI
ncbi:MAG: normocyte-binding protein [Bacillota bacterium]|nr:normocyte-binding protein [Bacillota bacterium]